MVEAAERLVFTVEESLGDGECLGSLRTALQLLPGVLRVEMSTQSFVKPSSPSLPTPIYANKHNCCHGFIY